MVTFVFSTISMTDQWDQAKPSSCQCRGVYSSRKTQCGCDPGRISKELTCVLWWHLFSQLFHWQTRGNKHKIFFSFQVPEILWHTIQCVSHIFGFNVSSWKGHVFRRKEKNNCPLCPPNPRTVTQNGGSWWKFCFLPFRGPVMAHWGRYESKITSNYISGGLGLFWGDLGLFWVVWGNSVKLRTVPDDALDWPVWL